MSFATFCQKHSRWEVATILAGVVLKKKKTLLNHNKRLDICRETFHFMQPQNVQASRSPGVVFVCSSAAFWSRHRRLGRCNRQPLSQLSFNVILVFQGLYSHRHLVFLEPEGSTFGSEGGVGKDILIGSNWAVRTRPKALPALTSILL